ncbi:PH domain-containing protein [Leucobacter sp. W1038]|uniref:PH domain-containing protein n=1 Tax=Leucobacter sp. W1038 TaxID=3438281 RepID=UPI003D9575A0
MTSDPLWERLHPLSPLLRGGLAILVIGGILLANFRDRILELFVAEQYLGAMGPNEGDLIDILVEQRLILVALGVALGIIVIIIFFSWLSWRFHTYRITDEAVEARSGVLFRQHRRAPLERIQSVNLQRPLLARILGLTQVEVQTAGQGGKVSLNYLGHRVAKEVRERILRSVARRRGESVAHTQAHDGTSVMPAVPAVSGGTPFEASPTGLPSRLDERAREFVDLDIDQAARASGSLVSVPIGRLLGSIALSWDIWIPVLLLVASIVSALIWNPFFLAMIIPAVLIAVGTSYSSFNKGFRFTLSRSSDGVRVGSGLTATHTETIPFGRIHAIEARQPLGWRPFGWWRVRVTTAGYGAAEAGQNSLRNVMLPVGHIDDVLRVIETLLPGVGDEPEELESLRSGLLGAGSAGGFLGAGPRAAWVLWLGKRRAGLRLEDEASENATLRVRRGWLTRSFVVMPILRAQSIQFSRPLLQRFIGLATLQAHTVLGPVQVVMRGIEVDQARAAFDTISRAMVRVQGGEAVRIRVERAKRAERAERVEWVGPAEPGDPATSVDRTIPLVQAMPLAEAEPPAHIPPALGEQT